MLSWRNHGNMGIEWIWNINEYGMIIFWNFMEYYHINMMDITDIIIMYGILWNVPMIILISIISMIHRSIKGFWIRINRMMIIMIVHMRYGEELCTFINKDT
jgi:hypothetical protein